MGKRALAILWAQWRSMRNYFPRSGKSGAVFTGLLTTVWYGVFGYLAVLAAVLLSNPGELDFIHRVLPAALLLCFLYWQLIPVLMASMGSSLDIRKLMVYPIPKSELFALEVLLRISTGVEMLLLITGAAVGLLRNPNIPWWAPGALGVFVIFNLFCSAGVRDLLVRLMARRRVREIVALFVVMVAALPQLILRNGPSDRLRRLFATEASPFLPWTATARLAEGEFGWQSAGGLLLWTALAYIFGRWQFERGLRFDAAEAAAKGTSAGRGASRLDWWYRLPGVVFPDPLGALIEKEMRFLSRAPRFRLVFLMGFSFGLLIWAPMAFGKAGAQHSIMADNYLALVSVYALLLLSDALFWNAFGFDRGAVQVYFLAPVKMSTVLAGKNIAAVSFVLMEIVAIGLVCALLRLPFTTLQVLEALAVTAVVTLFILSIGNLSSFYSPRAVNPSRSFRAGASGRMQAMLMVAFPVALVPVALAYLARYAFNTEWAFFGVLLGGAGLGAVVYSYSTASAVDAAEERKERIIRALSQGEGPIES
jgi:ABC-2 type transport system permease protein